MIGRYFENSGQKVKTSMGYAEYYEKRSKIQILVEIGSQRIKLEIPYSTLHKTMRRVKGKRFEGEQEA